jgi:glutamate synthase domain-containing protein 3
MAFNLHLSAVGVDNALDTVLNALNGGTVNIYTGTQPANCDTALSGNTLLVTLTLSATAFSAASAGVKTANAITSGVAVATGTATFFRAFKSDGTTAVIDGSYGTATTDMIGPTTTINSGDTVSCSSWTVSFPE